METAIVKQNCCAAGLAGLVVKMREFDVEIIALAHQIEACFQFSEAIRSGLTDTLVKLVAFIAQPGVLRVCLHGTLESRSTFGRVTTHVKVSDPEISPEHRVCGIESRRTLPLGDGLLMSAPVEKPVADV